MPQEVDNKNVEDKDPSDRGSAAEAANDAFRSELHESAHSAMQRDGKSASSNDLNDSISSRKPDIGSIADMLRPSDISSLTNFRVREGSHDLSTGDRYVVKNGKEILMTPSGDVVTVNSDGTYKVDGDLKGVEKDKNGNQVLVFKDGAKLTIGPNGIDEIERGNHTVRMSRKELYFPDPICVEPMPMPKWPSRSGFHLEKNEMK